MKKSIPILALALQAVVVLAQDQNDPTVLTIDEKEISKAEFETIFKKNNRDSVITKEDLDEYVELFINFKLKVSEAEEMGMDTMPQFERELRGYREQLARPYLVDKSTTDSLVTEAYERSQEEVRASHILIKLPADPSPQDTIAAYNKIIEIKKLVEANPDRFEQLASMRSEDPSAKTNGGDLGYFSVLQMVYPFESCVYNTEVGKIGGPVRTQYGYHLVKVVDRRDARGQVRVAHVMIRVEESDPIEVKESAKKRVDELYAKIEAGEDFATIAKKYSDDRSSAGKGGELPAFGTGKMVGEFEDAAFSIPFEGEVSEPVLSPYGWHIIKLIERIDPPTYEEAEKDLRNRISKDSRSFVSRDSFIEKRKEEYHFSEDRSRLKLFYNEIDSTYFQGTWEPSAKAQKANGVLFTLDSKEYTQADFLNFLKKQMRPNRKVVDSQVLVNDGYTNFVNKEIMAYEDSQLEKKYPEFRALMSEYRDGILLFDLTDQKVWSRAVKDSAGLAEYYAAHRNDFMWDVRADYVLYKVEDAKTGKAVQKMIKKGKSAEEIRTELNDESALKVTVESGLKEKKDVPVLSEVTWETGVSDVIDFEGQLVVVQIKEIRDAEPKELDEARGLITAAYQNELEKEWVESLRSTHSYEVDEEVLYSIK